MLSEESTHVAMEAKKSSQGRQQVDCARGDVVSMCEANFQNEIDVCGDHNEFAIGMLQPQDLRVLRRRTYVPA
jgi:hypothetical protein